MNAFNSYTDLKFNPNAFGSSSFSSGGGYSFPDYSGSFTPKIGSDTWQKGFALRGGDPFGLDKSSSQDKKQSPLTDLARFAGQALDAYTQSRNRQGDSSPFNVGGAGNVTQSGELIVVTPPPSTILPPQQSTFSRIAGTLAPFASLIPGVGPFISAGLGAASSLG
jgi:hypothetical protein